MFKRTIITTLASLVFASSLPGEPERPKVGLVLGGGGALGFAHIGALKVLEENNIPVDYIAGTSMGSIVGGMYACGMSPEEIENHFINLNWWDVLKDKSPHQYLTYRRKQEDKRFMGAEFGLQNWKLRFTPGMAYGQKLNNVLETFALNSTGITDFDQLNIPYRAIATDLRSGTSVVLKEGHLATAMRASMAVPGAFTPVRMNGYVFVDGGIFNNIPVNVVKEMGADIIIAIDVGASAAAESAEKEFRSLGEVISRTYTIMQRPDQEKQLAQADIVISPPLAGASSAQFHKADLIIPRGRIAAEQHLAELKKLSVDDDTYKAYLKNQRRERTGAVKITDIKIIGNDKVSEQTIRHRVRTKKGDLNLETVYADIKRIHGMGDFQTVTYDLDPNEEGYTLEYLTTEKFWGPHYLRFGFKFESSTEAQVLWSLLLNSTITQLNDAGGELHVDLEGGGNKRFMEGEWYQPLSKKGIGFIAPSASITDENIELYQNSKPIAEVEQQLYYGQIDAGISGLHFGEFRIGIRGGKAKGEGYSGLTPWFDFNDDILAAVVEFTLDQLNDPVLPTAGYQFRFNAQHSDENAGSDQTYSKVDFAVTLPFTAGRHTFMPALSAGSSLGTDLPFYELYALGGIDSFAGLAPYEDLGNYFGVGSLTYRYLLGKLPPTLGNGLFAVARMDLGGAWFDSADIRAENMNLGGMIGAAADTIFGTCSIAVGKAEGIDTVRLYLYLGNKF